MAGRPPRREQRRPDLAQRRPAARRPGRRPEGPGWCTRRARPGATARQGVAVALRLAGEALGHDGRTADWPRSRLSAALARSDEARRIDSPSFCHGQAGLLAITSSFARATGDPGCRRAVAAMAARAGRPVRPGRPARVPGPGARAGVGSTSRGLSTGAPGVSPRPAGCDLAHRAGLGPAVPARVASGHGATTPPGPGRPSSDGDGPVPAPRPPGRPRPLLPVEA